MLLHTIVGFYNSDSELFSPHNDNYIKKISKVFYIYQALLRIATIFNSLISKYIFVIVNKRSKEVIYHNMKSNILDDQFLFTINMKAALTAIFTCSLGKSKIICQKLKMSEYISLQSYQVVCKKSLKPLSIFP